VHKFECRPPLFSQQAYYFGYPRPRWQGKVLLDGRAKRADANEEKEGGGEANAFKLDDTHWVRKDGDASGSSAEYLEVVAMSKEPDFDVNASLCSDGFNPPIFMAIGASSAGASGHEDCLAFVLGLPGVDVNLMHQDGTALVFAAVRLIRAPHTPSTRTIVLRSLL
jgi:hypothetical protein